MSSDPAGSMYAVPPPETRTLTLDLSKVEPDDQPLISNVCAVLSEMRSDLPAQNIKIGVSGQTYYVTGTFPAGADVEISKADLDMLVSVNELRVTGVSVLNSGGQTSVKVKVVSTDCPIVVTSTSVVRIVKKRRWLS